MILLSCVFAPHHEDSAAKSFSFPPLYSYYSGTYKKLPVGEFEGARDADGGEREFAKGVGGGGDCPGKGIRIYLS